MDLIRTGYVTDLCKSSLSGRFNASQCFSRVQPCLNIPVQGRSKQLHVGDLPVLQCDATNASVGAVVEESVQATFLSPMNRLLAGKESMSSCAQSYRSYTKEDNFPATDLELFLLFDDNDYCINNDDEQVTQDFIRRFRSIEDVNDHLFRSWWENDNGRDDCKDGPHYEGLGTSDSSFLDSTGLSAESPSAGEVKNQATQVLPEPDRCGCHYETVGLGESFLDNDDGITVVRVFGEVENGCGPSRFRVVIPNQIMTAMPTPPNDLVSSPESVPNFNIEVRLVELQDLEHVDACIDWLLQLTSDGIALVCKHGVGGSLGLIQLSTHQRSVLIKVSPGVAAMQPIMSSKLRDLLFDHDITKVVLNVQKDVLALYYYLGLMTNNCVRVSQYFGIKQRKSLVNMCRELFHWEWSEKKRISFSDWATRDLSLEQVKYAVLDAWTTRLVWVGQAELWHVKAQSFSLGDLPRRLLDYFGRSVFCMEFQTRKDEDTSVEVKGASLEPHGGYLSLKQKNFRSRVMGQRSVVEVRFKDGRKPQKYVTLYREGSRVILDNAESSSIVKSTEQLLEEISMISKVLVDNSNNSDVQKQKLEESLYVLLCIPGACPRHILVALGCVQDCSMMISGRSLSFEEGVVKECKKGLNPGQLEAWRHMLLSPLSAVVGPPGTGKTTVITAVARAWLQLAGPGETLVCAAHQNVAVRYMAETMVKERLPGLLLLVSEDFYVGWHEEEYTQDLKDALVISGSQTTTALQNWLARNGNEPPRLVLCTLSLIGNDSFHASLMGSRVSSMIIDECSQAAEGSLIPALGSLPHLQMLSVVGDPCQLPPYGLRPIRSVFDLLAQSCEVKLLREQYRMSYRVAQFLSAQFYGGRLHTDWSKRWQDSDGALLWVNVKGTIDATSGTSLSNQEEAEAVVEWCRLMKRTSGGIGPRGKVVVLTLYEAQRSLISSLLGEEGMAEEVFVYNADSFQGQEAEVVLISLVVGPRVSGFAADRRRACVLLSRARRELLLFGNLDAIQSHNRSYSQNDNIWARLGRYCQCHGWVVSRGHVNSLVHQVGRSQ